MRVQLPVLCPSAKCEAGAILLGIVREEGQVCLADNRMIIDQAFVDVAKSGRRPEKRFRFASACIQGACRQWINNRCGIIDAVIQDVDKGSPLGELPECSIRQQCRWYRQRGGLACAVCPEVITDLRDSASDE